MYTRGPRGEGFYPPATEIQVRLHFLAVIFSICLSPDTFRLSIYLSIFLFIYLTIYLSIYLDWPWTRYLLYGNVWLLILQPLRICSNGYSRRRIVRTNTPSRFHLSGKREGMCICLKNSPPPNYFPPDVWYVFFKGFSRSIGENGWTLGEITFLVISI